MCRPRRRSPVVTWTGSPSEVRRTAVRPAVWAARARSAGGGPVQDAVVDPDARGGCEVDERLGVAEGG